MSKYLKSIAPETKGLVVKFIEDGLEGEFKGIVANPAETNYYFGQVENRWVKSCFEPYEPKESPLTNDNPNKVEVDDKDIKLRLECLKLALQYQISNPLIGAQGLYDWITKKPQTNE